MLRIKMDIKDAIDYDYEAAGYRVDLRGRQGFDFLYLIHDGVSPRTMDEALSFVRQTFYFSPHTVWVDGKILRE